MIYHVLNGDMLAQTFNGTTIKGEIVITRECLIEGGLQGDTLDEFWNTRAKYLATTYPDNGQDYNTYTVAQFNKLLNAPNHAEFNLWFGYDLFCQANLWFVIHLLYNLPITKHIYMVYPTFNKTNIWADFGPATKQHLDTCYQDRIKLSDADLQLGQQLWLAYKHNDLSLLKTLSGTQSKYFPYLKQVCEAHIERFANGGKYGRPETVIKDILENGITGFNDIFKAFFNREGIYGFGDLQVRRLVNKVKAEL